MASCQEDRKKFPGKDIENEQILSQISPSPGTCRNHLKLPIEEKNASTTHS